MRLPRAPLKFHVWVCVWVVRPTESRMTDKLLNSKYLSAIACGTDASILKNSPANSTAVTMCDYFQRNSIQNSRMVILMIL